MGFKSLQHNEHTTFKELFQQVGFKVEYNKYTMFRELFQQVGWQLCCIVLQYTIFKELFQQVGNLASQQQIATRAFQR